jgi:glycosyltransferase involved in cell wall biosynthesis
VHVLYITYNGLTEPLGQRQVIPYIVGLSARGWQYSVISFEKPETASPEAVRRIHQQLDQSGILWRRLPYHRNPTVLSTAYDAVRGLAAGLLTRGSIDLVHARSTVPAALAAGVGQLRRIPWIFDVRGLIAEEYADGGHWQREGLLFRLTARVERALLRRADGLVFLTDRIREDLQFKRRWVRQGRPVAAIPCSVDTTVFQPREAARRRVRKELRLGECPVLAYAGSLGSWYRLDEMLDFFEVAREQLPDLRFLVLTMNPDIALARVASRGPHHGVVVMQLEPPAVPEYLAAADAGICFLGQSFSKTASSPTKYGEYLATGLPLVADSWTGDAARWKGEQACLLVESFDRDAYSRTAARLRGLLANPARTRELARSLAERVFGLEEATNRYDALYREVLESAGARVGDSRNAR